MVGCRASARAQDSLYLYRKCIFYGIYIQKALRALTAYGSWLMAYGVWIMDLELSHDLLCASRSDDIRRAAGAAGFFSIQDSFYSNKSFSGLTAQRRGIFVSFREFRDSKNHKIRVNSCLFVVHNQ